MTLPALDRVRENFPKSHITILARPWVAPLFQDHPSVDRVILYEKGRGLLGDLIEIFRMIRCIRKEAFDLAICFQNAFDAALLAYLGGVKFRLGYNTDKRGFLLTHRVIRKEAVLLVHQVEYYLTLLRAMGWHAQDMEPTLHVNRDDMKKASDLLCSAGITEGEFILGLSPGAIFGAAKRWPPDRFAKIGDLAVERWGARVIVMGSRGERDIAHAVCNIMTNPAINFCGRTSLREAMAVISLLQFFVTNDSGLMHVAAALGVPTVAIFGSTDPVATGPRGKRTRIVKREVACAPCLKPECPKDSRCLLSIEPDQVWREMVNLRGSA